MRDQKHPPQRGSGFNRRDFLKGSGAAVAATAIATRAADEVRAQEAKKANVVSADAKEMTLNVNGKDHKLKLEPRAVLLDVLRNDLNLTGCKDVDDRTASGADTVIIDGKPVLASSRLAIQCVGQKIQTVESLANGKEVDDVLAGFVKHDAMQCGFCTPGFVMATRAFLNKNSKASLEEIRKGLGGNICRCGTYHGITACALEIAKSGSGSEGGA
jgi:xanthine dehydrogenase YagT iron-sulfur-binding subunit